MLNAKHIKAPKIDKLNHILYLSQPVGSGKTEALLYHIRDNIDQSFIYVVPTRRLAQEIKNRLDKNLINHGQGKNAHLIMSEPEENYAFPVSRRVMNHIIAGVRNQPHILIITTETFRTVLPIMTDEHKARYSVFLDEGIDAIDQVKFSTAEQEKYLELITTNNDGTFTVAKGKQELLKTVVTAPLRLVELGREELSAPNFIKLAKLLVSDIYDVYGVVTPKAIQAIGFLNPEQFLAFRSVTMVMAIFEQSLLALFWREKYGIKFQPFETDHLMFDTHLAKGPQIRIHYLLHPDDGASRYNLERDWETGQPNTKEYDDRRVIDQAAIAVEKEFGDKPYCWAANNFFQNLNEKLSGNRMPTKCAGLDSFKRFDIVVSMVCINPEPWVKNMITKHIAIADGDLYDLWKLTYTYQTIGRCSIRDRNSNRDVDVVVISKTCANQIQELFEGSEIVGQLTDLPSYVKKQRRRGPAKKKTLYTNSDNVAWYRFRKKNPNNIVSKEEWYLKIRNA